MRYLIGSINVNPFSFLLTDWNLFGGHFGETMLATKADDNGVMCKTYDGSIRFYKWGEWFTIRERYEINC